MKRTLIALVALTIGGCAQSPLEVMEEGTEHQLHSALAPEAFAQCVYRNTELKDAKLGTRHTPEGTGVLISVKIAVDPGGTLAVMKALPAPSGSDVTAWVSRRVFTAPTKVIQNMTEGC
jgi:hypothetical protein